MLSESITPEMLVELPVSTSIAVIGCGTLELIDSYAAESGCQFPIYTDPTRTLYQELGMTSTLSLGARPAYVRRSFAKGILDSVVQGLKQIPKGLAMSAGNSKQVGGEFLLETTRAGAAEDESAAEEKRVTWCHRMRSTRDHAEVAEVMEILGIRKGGDS